jgi:chromosome segregation ATPase
MGIVGAVVAIKQFVLAHKLAVGLTAAGATVGTVAYVKREALFDSWITRSKKYRGLSAQQLVNEHSIKQLDAELIRTKSELALAKDALENSEAERDALLLDKQKTAKELGRLEELDKQVLAFKAHIENLEKLNKQLEVDLAASQARERNQQNEIQRLHGQATDRLSELEDTAAEQAPAAEAQPSKGSHAAVPTRRTRAKATGGGHGTHAEGSSRTTTSA